jgi:two-component system LytT family response regulator
MKAVIVDDEIRSIEMLEWLLSAYCPEVEIVARFQAPESALAGIPKLETFDILFCDIAMPRMNGFDLVLSLPEPLFNIIFITAHNGTMQRALKNSGIDFLLKPVDDEELVSAIQKVGNYRNPVSHKQLADLRSMLPHA